MKVIVAGSRFFDNYEVVVRSIMVSGFHMTELVCGMCRGPDLIAASWAYREGIKVTPFPADWDKYGKAAGPIRNQQMADYADALVAIWDGKSRGTRSMIDRAKKKGLLVYVYRTD